MVLSIGQKIAIIEGPNMTFDKFLEDINTCLMMQAEEPVSNTEQCILISYFGYGKTVQQTVKNLQHNRKLAGFFKNV